MSEQIKNVVLVGRTGSGKSSTGDSILGEKLFISKPYGEGTTLECKMHRVTIQDGPIINVIDTPGLFDLTVSNRFINGEIMKCLSMVDEGIHAVLFVLSVTNRIGQEDESTFKALLSIFDTKIVDYFIVVFTGGDVLEPEGLTLDDVLGMYCPEFFTRILRSCGGRKVLFNNRTTDKDKKAAQLKQLLALVADVENQTGQPYTNQLHRQIKESKRLAAEVNAATVAMDNLKLEYEEKFMHMEQIVEKRIKEVSEAHIRSVNELREELSVNQTLFLKLEYDEKLMRMEQIMQIRIKETSETHIKAINELKEALSVNQTLSIKLEYNEKLMRMEQIMQIRIKEISEAHIQTINELREELSVNQALSVKLEYDEKLIQMEQIMQIRIKEISEAHIKAINELREALSVNQSLSVKLEYDEKLLQMEQIMQIKIKEISEGHIKAINEMIETLSVDQALSVRLKYDEKLMQMEQIMQIRIKEISEAHIKAINELREALSVNQALSVKLEYDEKLLQMEQIMQIRIKEISEANIKAINKLREALSVNQAPRELLLRIFMSTNIFPSLEHHHQP